MTHKKSVTIVFEPEGVNSKVNRGTRLLDALEMIGLTVRSECGGRGICGKCKVIVNDLSSFTKATKAEKELVGSGLKSGRRLACECSAIADATVYVPEESRVTARKLLIEGTERSVEVEPTIRKVFIRVHKPSLQDIRSDLERLQEAIKEIYGIKAVDIDYQLLKKLPEVLRDSDWKATVAVRDEREIISIEKGDTTEKAYGIAVDIGTSKIIIYVSDLFSGKLIATNSVENPQIRYGEDIVSRILYASASHVRLKELQRPVVMCLNRMISETCRKSRLNPQYIYEMTVVGNTAMHHFFLGIQPKYLGLSPHVPAIADPFNEKARNLFPGMNPAANVYVFPIIAGFVGGDAVADIVSTGLYESDILSMVLDIGTNTEVVIGDENGLVACSCASGPAFEGAHIKYGMKAERGAIEKLNIEPEERRVYFQTIGNVKPLGLCGSAIIDVIASLLKCRLIDANGTFAESSYTPRLKTVDGEKNFVLVSKMEGASRDIVVTQKDIREVQLAKAAIYTGCYILMSKKGVKPRDIKKLYVAGAFGNYLNIENSKLIGMLPDIPSESITFVGNAAGAGARMALISKKLRQTSALVSKKVTYVELALQPNFQSEFTSAMFFPHRDLQRFPSVRKLH
jgi:uncharacterized 2Fe-2S/4Fe-4S cluster protein (DUF4445 family)